jgi:hypothetical protein
MYYIRTLVVTSGRNSEVLRRNQSRKTQCYWSFLVLKRQNQFVQAKATNRR